MKTKKILETTKNNAEFNRVYKLHLYEQRQIRCTHCRYNKGENKKYRHYDGYDDYNDVKRPNWKLLSKNKKQWMSKKIKHEVKNGGIGFKTYYKFII